MVCTYITINVESQEESYRVRNLGPICPHRLRAGDTGGDPSPLPLPPPALLSTAPPPELAPRHNLRASKDSGGGAPPHGAAFGPASGGVFIRAGQRDGGWTTVVGWQSCGSSRGPSPAAANARLRVLAASSRHHM
jgi:hypothetical protein